MEISSSANSSATLASCVALALTVAVRRATRCVAVPMATAVRRSTARWVNVPRRSAVTVMRADRVALEAARCVRVARALALPTVAVMLRSRAVHVEYGPLQRVARIVSAAAVPVARAPAIASSYSSGKTCRVSASTSIEDRAAVTRYLMGDHLCRWCKESLEVNNTLPHNRKALM